MAAEGRVEKEIFTKGVVDGQQWGNGYGWRSAPTPAVYFNSERLSNSKIRYSRSDKINNREHMKLARTNKTPALQAIVEVKSSVTV